MTTHVSRKRISFKSHLGEDYYETLGVSPNADQETIQAIYRFLAKRYHPEKAQTRDGKTFLRVRKAYRILSDPDRRSRFDSKHRSLGLHGQRRVKAKSPMDLEEDEYLRRALLWLLYRCRREDVHLPSLGVLHLERDLGYSEGELEFHLWYLKQKGWVERTDAGGYAITADGVDRVAEGFVLQQKGGDDPAHGQPFRSAIPNGTYYRGPHLGDFGTETYAPGAVTGVETAGCRLNAPAGPGRVVGVFEDSVRPCRVMRRSARRTFRGLREGRRGVMRHQRQSLFAP